MKYINWQTRVLFLIIIFQSCINLKDSVIDEMEFLGNKTNPASIYEKQSDGTFLNPFNINTKNWGAGNIERLMLVEFKPLFGYKTIELQVIEKDGKTGGLVILYFEDGSQADVYHTPELELSKEMYTNVLNKTEVTETEIQYDFKEVSGNLSCELKMIDRFGNRIEMKAIEKRAEMKPVGLLAPIGGEAETPEFMTIVFMKHFKFLSQNEKNISVKINDVNAELVKLPIKVNGVKGYQTKYSMEPVTVSWNINFEGELEPIRLNKTKLFSSGDIEIETLENDGHIEIKRFSGIQKNHKINFRFSPAIPDLQSLKDNAKIDGRFSMSVDETTGIIAGEYSIWKQDNKIELIVQPTKGYSPVPGVAWMKKLTWTAAITKNKMGTFLMKSAWTKK